MWESYIKDLGLCRFGCMGESQRQTILRPRNRVILAATGHSSPLANSIVFCCPCVSRIYMCLFVCVHEHACDHECTCMWRPKVNNHIQLLSSPTLHLAYYLFVCFQQTLQPHLGLTDAVSLGGQGVACLQLSNTGDTGVFVHA